VLPRSGVVRGGGWWVLNLSWLEQKIFHHVIWITVVFRSNDSHCLLWKFSAIRVTRWLLLHLHCIKFIFAPTPLGELTTAEGLLVGWGAIPYPLDAFGVSLSTPSALNPRRLRRLDSNFWLRHCHHAMEWKSLVLNVDALQMVMMVVMMMMMILDDVVLLLSEMTNTARRWCWLQQLVTLWWWRSCLIITPASTKSTKWRSSTRPHRWICAIV